VSRHKKKPGYTLNVPGVTRKQMEKRQKKFRRKVLRRMREMEVWNEPMVSEKNKGGVFYKLLFFIALVAVLCFLNWG